MNTEKQYFDTAYIEESDRKFTVYLYDQNNAYATPVKIIRTNYSVSSSDGITAFVVDEWGAEFYCRNKFKSEEEVKLFLSDIDAKARQCDISNNSAWAGA